VDEPHVQHSVGFIEDKKFDLTEVNVALSVKIEKSTWSRHKNIDPLPQGSNLWALVYATKDDPVSEGKVPTIQLEAIADLGSQFSRGGQDEGLDGRLSRAWHLAENLKDGQQKSSGLPCASLCAAEDISPLQQWRYGGCLDGCWVLVSLFGECALKGLDEIERFKAVHESPG